MFSVTKILSIAIYILKVLTEKNVVQKYVGFIFKLTGCLQCLGINSVIQIAFNILCKLTLFHLNREIDFLLALIQTFKYTTTKSVQYLNNTYTLYTLLTNEKRAVHYTADSRAHSTLTHSGADTNISMTIYLHQNHFFISLSLIVLRSLLKCSITCVD